MANVLDEVRRRTQLVGHNRLELLLFRLDGEQRFAINVFKVREVITCPELIWVPNAHVSVCGLATIRGKTVPIIDLGTSLGRDPIEEPGDGFVIVTEFNRSVQGFLVSSVDRIANLHWEGIEPPPRGADQETYLTAVTRVDERMVEVVDVEMVFSEVMGIQDSVSTEVLLARGEDATLRDGRHILVVDDSSVARNQIKRTLDQIGIPCRLANNGRQALDMLRGWAQDGDINEQISMVISDIEMPKMDGYTLTAHIRKDARLKGLFVLLHSSLSGVFNNAMVERVGANRFIAKFNADDLASVVLEEMHKRAGNLAA